MVAVLSADEADRQQARHLQAAHPDEQFKELSLWKAGPLLAAKNERVP
jgi:hypothetical protein